MLQRFELHACEYLGAAAVRHGKAQSRQNNLPDGAWLLIEAPAEQLTPERLSQALDTLNGISNRNSGPCANTSPLPSPRALP